MRRVETLYKCGYIRIGTVSVFEFALNLFCFFFFRSYFSDAIRETAYVVSVEKVPLN